MKKKGEKITPQSWKTEIEAIDEALPGIEEKIDDAVIKLAYCKTITHGAYGAPDEHRQRNRVVSAGVF